MLVKKKYYMDTFAHAAENGNLENMKWMLENNFPFGNLTFSFKCS